MSNVAVDVRDYPLPSIRLDRLGLRDLRFDEFSTSPVDEIQRAIEKQRAQSWQRGQFPPSTDRLVYSLDVIENDNDLTRGAFKDITSRLVEAIFKSSTEKASSSAEDAGEEKFQKQLGLPVAGDFSPSKTLSDLWVASLLALGDEAGRLTSIPSDFEVAQEFSHTLSSLFGTIGQQLRFKKTAELAVTRSTRFLPSYQIQICDSFLIVPDQAAAFLEMLRAEMHAAITAGCQIAGAWGRIGVTRGGDLHLLLESPIFVPAGNFEESEEIE